MRLMRFTSPRLFVATVPHALAEWRTGRAMSGRSRVEPHIWIWVWVLLALILSVAEVVSGGFYALPFAIGAIVAAGLEFIRPRSIEWQWLAFLGVSSAIFVVAQRLLRRGRTP